MGFLKENKTLVILFVLSAAVALLGTPRNDNIGTWLIIIGILLTLIVGLLSSYITHKDKEELTNKIASLKNTNENLKNEVELLREENEKLGKNQKTLEETFEVERDVDGNITDHAFTWKDIK